MAQEKPVFDYHEESHSEKLARKSKESPFMVIGEFHGGFQLNVFIRNILIPPVELCLNLDSINNAD